jgi:hypothetical protein
MSAPKTFAAKAAAVLIAATIFGGSVGRYRFGHRSWPLSNPRQHRIAEPTSTVPAIPFRVPAAIGERSRRQHVQRHAVAMGRIAIVSTPKLRALAPTTAGSPAIFNVPRPGSFSGARAAIPTAFQTDPTKSLSPPHGRLLDPPDTDPCCIGANPRPIRDGRSPR